MTLQRRTLLQIAAGLGVGLAGCFGTGDTDGPTTKTPTESPGRNPVARDIFVDVNNHLPETITVSVELSTAQTVLLDEEATIEANGFTGFDTGIEETGQYDLTLGTDDREKELSFAVEEDDLEMGSNVVFWIDEDRIRYGIEN
jgi:hypothetical protein